MTDSEQRINKSFEIGDKIIIEGIFKPRTFWEWLTRKPRSIKEFIVTELSE